MTVSPMQDGARKKWIRYTCVTDFFVFFVRASVYRGGSTGVQEGRGPQWKMWPPVAPHFGPASLDFHLNRPVISLIQLHIVPRLPSWNCGPHCPPIWLVPEPPPSVYRIRYPHRVWTVPQRPLQGPRETPIKSNLIYEVTDYRVNNSAMGLGCDWRHEHRRRLAIIKSFISSHNHENNARRPQPRYTTILQ